MRKLFKRHAVVSAGLFWLVTAIALEHPAFAVRNFKIGDSLSTLFAPSADGKASTYEPRQFAGRPAAIVFWRPNHEFSLEVIRDMQAVAQEIGASKFTLLAIDSKRSTAQEVQTALADETISFPILLDPDRVLYERVGLIVCPTTLLFDDKGNLRFIVTSNPSHFHRVVQARLRFLLGEIDEETMDQQIKPTIFKVDQNLAAAWRTYNLGKQLQTQGNPDQAMAVYERAISQHPALTEAHCALGFLELEAGNLPAAARHFANSLAYQANSSAAQLGQAAVLARTNNVQQAEHILLSLLEQPSKPIYVRVRYELARIYHLRGEFEKAAGYYRDAMASIFPEPASTSMKAAATR